MAEDAVQQQSAVAEKNAQDSEQDSSETQQERRPNAFAFSGILLGGWAALMIAFTLIAVIAMSVVGMVAG
ncbi:MAG: hypothetical protein OXF50_07645 [Caldilineaceae bacterium]|nr:hypothetical protein [Caldilineaceae bacterium]MCY3991087.1 hypothetical protein [Caldilineaceae bacterium]